MREFKNICKTFVAVSLGAIILAGTGGQVLNARVNQIDSSVIKLEDTKDKVIEGNLLKNKNSSGEILLTKNGAPEELKMHRASRGVGYLKRDTTGIKSDNTKITLKKDEKVDLVYENDEYSKVKIDDKYVFVENKDIDRKEPERKVARVEQDNNNDTKVEKKVKRVRKVERKDSKPKSQEVKRENSNKSTTRVAHKVSGKRKAAFSAYYPENSRLQGGFYDAMGNRLNPANNTCAAPKSVPFGTKFLVEGTGTHIDGQVFTVTDRGGAIVMKEDGTIRIDILMKDRPSAYGFGRRTGYVTEVK